MPNDFLKCTFTLPSDLCPTERMSITAAHLTHLWKQANEHTNTFWHIWKETYLHRLRTTHHQLPPFPKNTSKSPPKLNTIVLVMEPHLKRPNWKLGKITKLNISEDGEIRSANLQVANKQIITRPLYHLYPLKVPTTEDLSTFSHISSNLPSTVDADQGGCTL